MTQLPLPSPLTLNLIIALCMLLLDRVWHIPARIHPLTLYRILVKNMAQRVCPDNSAPVSQHYISGTLGIVVLTIPFLIVLAFVLSLAEFGWFFDSLILFCCLNFYAVRHQFKLIIQALSSNKKLLARERLTQLVARQTESLSDIGIAKAAIESYLLRFIQQSLGVVLWFLIAGPLAALSYRLLLEFRWQWHRKNPRFRWFGQPAFWLSQILLIPPYCFAILLSVLASSPPGSLKGMLKAPQRDLTSLVLAAFGGGLAFQLGGPAYYNGTKYRDKRVGGERLVRFSDMTYTLRAINRATWLMIIFLTFLMIISWQLKL